jgi:hypothetical protein
MSATRREEATGCDTALAATSDEVEALRREADALKEFVAERSGRPQHC